MIAALRVLVDKGSFDLGETGAQISASNQGHISLLVDWSTLCFLILNSHLNKYDTQCFK